MSNWSIFGIGPVEAIFIIIMMLIILGPKDMVNTGRRLGSALRRIRNSPTWRMISSTSQAIRNLPDTLASETGIDELQRELLKGTESIKDIRKDIDGLGKIEPRPATSSSKKDAAAESQAGQGEEPQPDEAPEGTAKKAGAAQEPSFAAWTTPPKIPADPPEEPEQANGAAVPDSNPTEKTE